MPSTRLRDLGITIGRMPTGEHNAITDVPGVQVGYTTLIYDEPRIARTGVTAIVPRAGEIWRNNACAGYFSFNGTGEMTGMHYLTESGMLCYPVILTTTHQVGTAHQAVIAYGQERGLSELSALPVVAETYDGWLNDIDAFHIQGEHVFAALDNAHGGPIAEGNVGGGTGMICHDFKGGTGTASRRVAAPSGEFTLGVLVQANYGDRQDLRVDGAPVGRILDCEHTPCPWRPGRRVESSIIVVIATDAPMLPGQCARLARRATVGLARVGGIGHNYSGDLFLAFATGNSIPADAAAPIPLQMLPHNHLDLFFNAVAEAVEEAILNALLAAKTMTGRAGRSAYALPAEALKNAWLAYQNG